MPEWVEPELADHGSNTDIYTDLALHPDGRISCRAEKYESDYLCKKLAPPGTGWKCYRVWPYTEGKWNIFVSKEDYSILTVIHEWEHYPCKNDVIDVIVPKEILDKMAEYAKQLG